MSNIHKIYKGLPIRLSEAEVQLVCLSLGAYMGMLSRDQPGPMPQSVVDGVQGVMDKINKAREEANGNQP